MFSYHHHSVLNLSSLTISSKLTDMLLQHAQGHAAEVRYRLLSLLAVCQVLADCEKDACSLALRGGVEQIQRLHGIFGLCSSESDRQSRHVDSRKLARGSRVGGARASLLVSQWPQARLR